jgi:DNA repair protein SbcD/Mre11
MKLLAISDSHIGAGYDHRKDALADTDAIFAQVIALAVERGVDLVLHAGDVFHRAKPSPAELHVFKRFCDQLSEAGIPMVAIGGNGLHEAAPGQKSALELFESRLVRVSRTPEVITEFAGVAVCTLPAVPVSRLVAQRNGGSREESYQEAIDLLLRAAHDLFEAAPSDRPRILLAHQMVSGASLPTGLLVEQVGSVVLPLHELERIGFDAIVLGDLHKPQLLNGRTFYCGSPMTMDFGEHDDEHGCWILDLDTIGTLHAPPEFVPLQGRRFITVEVDLTEEFQVPSLDDTDYIAAMIASKFPLTDAVIRIRYKATEEQHRRVDHAAFTRLLDDAGIHRLYGGIRWDPVRDTRARVEGFDESLDPMSAVDLWLAANTVDEPQAGALRALLGGYLGAL